MANKRCIPTRFFKDPDIINLRKDTQLILIGLVLNADDEGREVAHTKVLGQEMDYPPEQIETALQELVENDLIVLYQAGKHRYYSLTHQWQSLGSKMTPSRFPAPPQGEKTDVPTETPEPVGHSVGNSGVPLEVPESGGVSAGNPAQVKLSKVNLSEGVEEKTPPSDALPSNVVPFPTSTSGDGDGVSDEHREQVTVQVAAILTLPVTPALRRVVHEFIHDSALSLLSEADAAREYIESPTRNKQGTAMTPAFFRRWLKRERGDYSPAGQSPPLQGNHAVGQTAAPPGAGQERAQHGLLTHSLQDLEQQYRASRSIHPRKSTETPKIAPPCERGKGDQESEGTEHESTGPHPGRR